MNGHIYLDFEENERGMACKVDSNISSDEPLGDVLMDKIMLMGAFINALDLTYMEWLFLRDTIREEEYPKIAQIEFKEDIARDILLLAEFMKDKKEN